MRFIFSFLLIALSVNSLAQSNYLMVMGGGGEPKGNPSTIFDAELASIGAFAKSNPNWQSSVIFDGGHAQTEAIVSQHFGRFNPAGQTFSSKNFEALIALYERRLNSGEIKSGDKLLVHINSHGALRDAKGEETHRISTSDAAATNLQTLGGVTVPLDRLKNLSELAAKKGVKLGIVDLSCHSGSTLNLANANTCVISATGPEHYSFGGGATFSAKFNQAMAKGKSLEEVFLTARSNYGDTSFPMISTPQGRDVQSRIYELLTPYLYYFDPQSDKHTKYLEREIQSLNTCAPQEDLKELVTLVEELLKTVGGADTQRELQYFKTSVTNYFNYLAKTREEMRAAGFPQALERVSFCSNLKAPINRRGARTRECTEYRVKDLVALDVDRVQAHFRDMSRRSKGEEALIAQAISENLDQARKKKAELLRQNPRLAKLADFWKSNPNRRQESFALAAHVSKSHQRLFEKLYRQSPATGPNPCRDFVL